jgi:hypothetical protein
MTYLPGYKGFSNSRFVLWLIILIFLFCKIEPVLSQRRLQSKQVSLALEIGNWQPHSLNDEPRFTTFGAAGATPFWGLTFGFPFTGDLGFQISVGYWSLRDLEKIETVHSLTMHPVNLFIKHWLVPDNNLSAYVIYGGGMYWGVENETFPLGAKLKKAVGGWGATLGAGFDLTLAKHWGIGGSFQYQYVTFKDPIGGVDDFSGPKISLLVFLFL